MMIKNSAAKAHVWAELSEAKRLGARRGGDISRDDTKSGELYALFTIGAFRVELHASLSTGMVYYYDETCTLAHEERDAARARWVADRVIALRAPPNPWGE